MRFPKIIKYRKVEVTIYGKKKSYPFYRIAYRVDGKRKMKSFAGYSEAKTEADKLAKEISQGSPVAALSASQARDAITAFERLQNLYASTGRRISLLAAVSEFADATNKLNGRVLGDVVEGYLKSVASVKRKDVAEAVEEFIAIRKPLTEAKAGKRAQLSKGYAYMVGLWLKEFAKTFPETAICDLSKDHLNLYMRKHEKHSPKSRNHFRGAVKMFLTWCAKRDFISPTHRLFEADTMTTEAADMKEVEFYDPKELAAMLECASNNPDYQALLPVIALGGLAGLRLEETLRLEWADIWRVAGHIEIKALKAKTRSRRLVEMCDSLALWLEPYREFSGMVFAKSNDTFHESFTSLRDSLKITARRNGLRHAFCTYHFAAHANENLTAQQAGNSPAMVHQHYKGLATKAEAKKWFDVRPTKMENVILLNASA